MSHDQSSERHMFRIDLGEPPAGGFARPLLDTPPVGGEINITATVEKLHTALARLEKP